MTYYAAVSALIILIGYLSYRSKNERLYIGSILIIMIVFAGFRGDFTSDYSNYVYIFRNIENYGVIETFARGQSQEIGFLIYTKLMTMLGSETLYFFGMSTISILFFNKIIKEYSSIQWLSLAIFVGLGSYYTMFNVSRQIMACAIMFLGSKYLYTRKFKIYCLHILLSMCFHSIALIMLPLYFLLNIKITKKHIIGAIIIFITAFVGMDFFLGVFQSILPKYNLYTTESYGMQGGALGYVIVPCCILALCMGSMLLINRQTFDINESQNRIQLNAMLYTVLFAFMSLKIYMVIRFIYFVEPFGWILLPNLISNFKLSGNRKIVIAFIVLLIIIIPIVTLSGTGYDPYYFIWQQ